MCNEAQQGPPGMIDFFDDLCFMLIGDFILQVYFGLYFVLRVLILVKQALGTQLVRWVASRLDWVYIERSRKESKQHEHHIQNQYGLDCQSLSQNSKLEYLVYHNRKETKKDK